MDEESDDFYDDDDSDSDDGADSHDGHLFCDRLADIAPFVVALTASRCDVDRC